MNIMKIYLRSKEHTFYHLFTRYSMISAPATPLYKLEIILHGHSSSLALSRCMSVVKNIFKTVFYFFKTI